MNLRKIMFQVLTVAVLTPVFLSSEPSEAKVFQNPPTLWTRGWCCVTRDENGNITGLHFMNQNPSGLEVLFSCDGAGDSVTTQTCAQVNNTR